MRVLLTGANGFIGAQLTAALLAAGHQVVAAVRNPAAFAARFPDAVAIAADMNRDTALAAWLPRLVGVDAAVNCAGVLQGGRGQDMEAIHHLAPAALFDACREAGVRRVVQISAISADTEAGTEYALSKKRGDDHLKALDLDWVVLRPSLIYGEGAYGGTAMLRALAAFPLVTPTVGGGGQPFRPLHVEDLARTVLECLVRPDLARRVLEPVGPQVETLKSIVAQYRAWLGRPPAPALPIPLFLVRLICRLGDLLGRGPVSSTALAQMQYGNAGRDTGFAEIIGFQPATLAHRLQIRPAQTQDLWHARLYLMRPLVRLSLVVFWMVAGIGGLLTAKGFARQLAAAADLRMDMVVAVYHAVAVIDFVFAGLVVANWRPRTTGLLQLALLIVYPLVLTALAPALWPFHFWPLQSYLGILVLVLVQMVLAEER